MTRPGLVRTSLLLLPVQVVFRAGEVVFPLLLAMWFGATKATDVYNFSWATFYFAGSLIFGAFHDSAIVPILTEIKLRDPSSLRRVVGSLLAHTWAIGGALAVVVATIALAWFSYLYRGEELSLAAKMVPAFALQLVALSTKTFFASICTAHHKFVPFPATSAMSIVVTITFVAVMHGQLGVLSVPIGSLLGEVTAASVLAFVVIRHLGVKPELTFERPEPVKRFAKLVISEVGGSAVTRINPVVDQLMAGLAGVAGGVTLLRYSGDVASVSTSLLQATFLSVLLAHLADDYARRDFARVRATVGRAVLIVPMLLATVALLLYWQRLPLLKLVFDYGAMKKTDGVVLMSDIFPYHLVGAAGFGALLVLARANVAIQNSRIMFGMGVLNASLNVVLNLVLLRVLGLKGIALSTSLVHTTIAIVFWFRFQKRIRELSSPVTVPEPA